MNNIVEYQQGGRGELNFVFLVINLSINQCHIASFILQPVSQLNAE